MRHGFPSRDTRRQRIAGFWRKPETLWKDLLSGGGLALLIRFGLVGVAATVLYAALAIVLMEPGPAGLPPVPASLAAYAVAALFSYLAHKWVTFMSHDRHRREVPRFLLLTVTGLAVACAAPAILTDMLALPGVVAVMVTCILVPALNLLVLDRWVFRGRNPGSRRSLQPPDRS